MKKSICIVVAVLILCACATTGFAAGEETFEIPELDMTVGAPDTEGLLVNIVGGAHNELMDEWLNILEITKEEFDEEISGTGNYLTIVDPEQTFEYSVLVLEHPEYEYLYDMDVLPQNELDNILKKLEKANIANMEELRDLFESQGVQVADDTEMEKASIEKVGGNTYIKGTANASSNGMDMWSHSYATVKNGRMIQIRILTYAGPATEAQRAELLHMVENTSFENIPPTGKTYVQDKAMGTTMLFVVIAVAAVIVVACILVVTRKRKKAQSIASAGGAPQWSQADFRPITPSQAVQQPFVQQPQAEPQSAEELVKRLEELKEKGVLTQAEFEQKKHEIENRDGGSGNA